MSIERNPIAFGDLRGWIDALRLSGELHEIDVQVDWQFEIGTVMRLARGADTGPALLFNNIKDYNTAASRCQRIVGCGLSSYGRVAMMLELPPDTHPRELVKIGRNILTGTVPPKIAQTGPVKENVITGKDVDLYEFSTPHWNRIEGGRYLITYAGCVTKEPETNVMNVGIYRGMLADRNRIPVFMYRAQHIGHHALAWEQLKHKEMPIAFVIGWEPSLGFCAGAPVPKGVCEYDVMGAIRGQPVELVKCETFDLHVPAAAAALSMFGLGPFFSPLAGYIADRVNQKLFQIVSFAAMAVIGYIIFNVAKTLLEHNVLSRLEGVAGGFAYANGYSLVQRSVRGSLVGRVGRYYHASTALPAVVSGYILAKLVDFFGWGHSATILMSLLMVIPIAMSLFIDTSRITGPGRCLLPDPRLWT